MTHQMVIRNGQAAWDKENAPSGWHGVTTVVMGNCGVGFAPARREQHADRARIVAQIALRGAGLATGVFREPAVLTRG